MEIPTGNADDGLGSGHVQAFLPLWLQKDFGSWTIYGGGGYGINPKSGNRNWGFAGALLQDQVRQNLLIGAEICHRTATQVGERDDTAFNLGTIWERCLTSANTTIYSSRPDARLTDQPNSKCVSPANSPSGRNGFIMNTPRRAGWMA